MKTWIKTRWWIWTHPFRAASIRRYLAATPLEDDYAFCAVDSNGAGIVRFVGGPVDGRVARVIASPPRLLIDGQHIYERIVDPDTGDFLGGYAYRDEAEGL